MIALPVPPIAPESTTDIVVFTIGLIALMQFGAWWREREPGMRWFAAGSLLTTLLVADGGTATGAGVLPGDGSLMLMYLIRGLFTLGMVGYLGIAGRVRVAFVSALVLPGVAITLAMLAGHPADRLPALLPFLWGDTGLSLVCLYAARRQPDAGHALLALAALIGPLAALIEPLRGHVQHLTHDFPAVAISLGLLVLVVSLLRKSRDSKLAQAQAQRMSNYYAALSHTNQAILRIHEPSTLYAEICRICVDWGHATMACVYLLGDDGLLSRAASAGPAAQILQGFPDPWDTRTPEAAASHTVRAMRDNRCVVSHDYLGDRLSAPWHDRARAHGVRTIAWLPLRRGGAVVGVLMLAAGEVGFFEQALVRLLDEMTNDISFALDNMDRETRHLESTRQVQAGLDRFTRLFQAAPVASSIVSIDGRRVVDVNDAICERYEASRAELIGRTTSELSYSALPEDRERFYEALRRDGRVRNLLLHMKDAHGRIHQELMNAEPIDYLGEPCHLVMSLDITELRAAEGARQAMAEAQAASRAKTEFLSRMSHELRTPLNAVLGFSALLQQDVANRLGEREREQLAHVQQAGWHLLRLINDVLDLSRIEAGQFGVDVHALALSPLLDEALQMSQPLATQFQVALQADYGQSAGLGALADPTRLRQVVLNVLTNAIKYNRPGGTVHVGLARAGARVSITVADNGIGMTPQQLAQLFEPFNRLGRDGQGIEGTGIGLALTRQLMHLMDGEVTVSSDPARGTRLVLTLPQAHDLQAGAPAAPPAPPAADDAASPRGTVLYIEDSAVNSLLVTQLLARWPGIRCHVAEDGVTGLRMATELRPDLVLLDMQLPDIDGLQVLRRLRADKLLQCVPVVVLSASAMPDEIALARGEGATDYWTKPLDFPRFLANVASLLRPPGIER